MAKQTLPTNFKDDVLAAAMGGKRRYILTNNGDGTFCLEDATTYTQVGDVFGAARLNAICEAVNESVDQASVLDTLSEIIANTKDGYIAGAMAVKELEARSGGCALSYNENDDQFYIKGWGADAVWVSLGKMERTFLGNTSGGTIDCTGIKNYQKLTAENFSLVPVNLYAANNPPSGTSSENAGMTVDKALADMSYNPDTGVLTVPSMTVSDTYSYGDYWDKSITAKVTVAVYCYHQGVYNSGGTKMVNGTAVRSGTTIIKADTGLTSVKGIILCLDGDIPSKNITRGALYSDILSLIFQYGSTAKATYAVDGSAAMSIEDGVVTITTPSESYPYNTGTYNWIAWGE